MSQITIGGTTLNFKDSAFTGDQWEQVASWVLNGGAEGIDANAQIATEKAAAASASAAAARNSATSAGESASAAASSATAAASSATAAKSSEDAAAGSATNAAASATSAANSAANASDSATAAATSAQTAQNAASTATGAASMASTAAEKASGSASKAQESATAAADSAASVDGINKTAQSWAVGGTGTRDGENTDNAKYYSEQAGAVVNSLNNAHIDENGHLVYTSPSGSTVDLGEVVGKDGVDGSSIQSIERTSGTGAPGTTDTYTVTLTNGDTTTFQVYNGKDGSGSGDMTKAVYDTQGKAQDIFAYADAKYSKPSGGIPKTDLASDVQDSLTKVDNMAANVKDYGAIGDGVTDDTAALQLAFDSTAAQGGNLYIPEGDYKITGQLTIADPICVSGDGCLKLYDPDSSAEFVALTVDNGVRVSGLKLEAQEGFAGVILKYYPTSNSIYPSRTRFKSLILQSLSTQKILSYFDVYGGNNYGLIIEDVTIGKPNTARYCQYGMRILTEGGYAGAGASWENSGTVRNLRIDTRGDHQLYVVGASGGMMPKNWVFENIAIQTNSKLQSGDAFTYQDSFYLYRFAEVTLRNCKVWDASAAAYAEGRAPVVYEDIIATTYIDGCAPAFYLDSGAVVLSTATTPEVTAYRQQYVYDQLKEIAEKFDISSLTVSKTETDAETTLIFSDGTNTKSIAVSKVQATDAQVQAGVAAWLEANAKPTVVWSKNVLNVNDENVSMGYIAAGGQINNSDAYWSSGYIPARRGDVLRSSLNGATARFAYVAEYDSAKKLLTRVSKSEYTYTVSNESAAYIRVSWKTSAVSYKNAKAMLTLNNTDLSFEEYGSHTEGGLGEYLVLTSPNGKRWTLKVSDAGALSAEEIV